MNAAAAPMDSDDERDLALGEEEDFAVVEEDEDEEEEEEEGHGPRDARIWNQLLNAFMVSQHRDLENNTGLVEYLATRGMLADADEAVRDAFLAVPRHLFVTEDCRGEAYVDAPLRLQRFGFNVSAPSMHAICLAALRPAPGKRFLDVGSGCGLLTCVAALLSYPTEAVGLELRSEIVQFSRENAAGLREHSPRPFKVRFELRNAFLPSSDGLYDLIHVGASCPLARVNDLLSLLGPNGTMVVPMGEDLMEFKTDGAGQVASRRSLQKVRYGDLVIPSAADVAAAQMQLEVEQAKRLDVPASTFVADMGRLLGPDGADLADVRLQVSGGEAMLAHRAVLAARCPLFRAMFASGMREATASGVVSVPLPEFVTAAAAQAALEYMYTDRFEADPETLSDVLAVAGYLELSGLQAQCEVHIRDALDVDNVAKVLALADSTGSRLKRVAIEFMIEHWGAVRASDGFAELGRDLVVEVTDAVVGRFRS